MENYLNFSSNFLAYPNTTTPLKCSSPIKKTHKAAYRLPLHVFRAPSKRIYSNMQESFGSPPLSNFLQDTSANK